jgi:hypothetical protein
MARSQSSRTLGGGVTSVTGGAGSDTSAAAVVDTYLAAVGLSLQKARRHAFVSPPPWCACYEGAAGMTRAA